jgi:festuclavine dehydrogenase
MPYLVASRKAVTLPAIPAIKFDWNESGTWEAVFQHPFPNNEKIRAIYLITPEISDPAPVMNSFIDLAVQKGVHRFVLVTGTSATSGGPYTGAVWSYLDGLAVEYTILRVTWINGKRFQLMGIKIC